MPRLTSLVKAIFRTVGIEIRRSSPLLTELAPRFPVELDQEEQEIIAYILERRLSMTSVESLATTLMACKHAVSRDIPGDFVECGVWRGGNALLAAWAFRHFGADKKVFLFDTFAGMTAPSDKDCDPSLMQIFLDHQRQTHNEWVYASLEDVKGNFKGANLLTEGVVFVQGSVLETLVHEENLPTRISVLRLDTDWYESTKKELEVLYPRLSIGGSLIIDDYGFFVGARNATEDYFALNGGRPFLQPVDSTVRAGVKND